MTMYLFVLYATLLLLLENIVLLKVGCCIPFKTNCIQHIGALFTYDFSYPIMLSMNVLETLSSIFGA